MTPCIARPAFGYHVQDILDEYTTPTNVRVLVSMEEPAVGRNRPATEGMDHNTGQLAYQCRTVQSPKILSEMRGFDSDWNLPYRLALRAHPTEI